MRCTRAGCAPALVHRAAGVHRLVLVRDRAALEQVDEAVGEHLGVHAQVALLAQARHHGVGDAADAHLQAGAVLHQAGDEFADARLDLGLGLRRVRRAAAGSVRANADTRANGTTELPCVRGMHWLTSHRRSGVTSATARAASSRGPQRAQPVRVRRRQLQQRRVETDAAGLEERDLGKGHRDEVRAPSSIAARTLPPAKGSEIERNRPACSGAANAASPSMCILVLRSV